MNVNLFRLLNDLAGRYDWIDDFMEFCAQDIVWIMLAVMALLWLSGKTANQKLVFYSGLSAAVALIVASFLLSPGINHPRPFVGHTVHQLIPHAPDPSFPSDHATLAFSLAFGVWFANRRLLGAHLFLLALLTGVARVYVGVHYPADILGAMVLSLITCFAIAKMNRRMDAAPMLFIRLYRKLTNKLSLAFLPRSK
ncbi:undecaprenyl-diphosphatase [Cohnella faecalis]|uniref:Undecaprenyl-diphosphatase n=1 Tax=Cohnella faecalis TaxID=2315694 RepID=A0A398CQ77_9BACL|nr:undecaprenyl-diphosphatase [Cohnella faecalis]RIE03459.1 undecaprenyl-diphosphatase [Cohnella faecalis]